MSHHDMILLKHLGEQLILLYCNYRVELSVLGKQFIRHRLMLQIARYLEIDYDLLPSDQVFYNALRGIFCSSGTKEKLAAFYYAIKEPQKFAERKEYFMQVLNWERLTATPLWDEFVREYEEQKNKAKGCVLPPQVSKWLGKQKPAVRKMLYEWLKMEQEQGVQWN